MKIFIWRHSKLYSSWSMFDEPHVLKDNYLQAEVAVLAETEEEALDLIAQDDKWNRDQLARISPVVMELDKPAVVTRCIQF